MSPELVSGIARVAHEKLLSVLTEAAQRRRKAHAFLQAILYVI